ncbi:MAG: lipase family alpha/beta hydrolase [Pseudonocardia sp.]
MALFRAVSDLAGALAATSRGLTVEACWLTARALTYPLGFAPEQFLPADPGYRVQDLPPGRRGLLVTDLDAARTPIVLLHGFLDNRGAFSRFRRTLRRRGFGCVHAVNYNPLLDDVRTAAAQLATQIDRIREHTGADRVHVVGHSLGGIVARYHVQRLGGHTAVDTVATLGSPHGGSAVAGWLPGPLGRQLRPGSELLAELAEPATECDTRFLVVWSRLDQVMIPRTTARLQHPDLDVEELELRDVGHATLPLDGRVAHWVSARLARSGPRGASRAPTSPATLRGGSASAS